MKKTDSNMKNETATYWLNEINAGTVKGAIAQNPTTATEFFGSLPVMRKDAEELRIIAGSAWRMSASDEQLAGPQSAEAEMFGTSQTPDEIRAEATRLYQSGQRGEHYSPLRTDGSRK